MLTVTLVTAPLEIRKKVRDPRAGKEGVLRGTQQGRARRQAVAQPAVTVGP